jgi:hypothetical protein
MMGAINGGMTITVPGGLHRVAELREELCIGYCNITKC